MKFYSWKKHNRFPFPVFKFNIKTRQIDGFWVGGRNMGFM